MLRLQIQESSEKYSRYWCKLSCTNELEILKNVKFVNLDVLEQTISAAGGGTLVDKTGLHIINLLSAIVDLLIEP
jgi:hypothetical protein